MRKVRLLLSVFLLLVLHSLLYAQSPEPIGTITFVEGICDIVHNNQESVLASEKAPVYVNDRVRTKSYSKMEITFADKSVLRLAPESCAVVEEYKLDGQKKRELSRIQLTRGKIEAVVSKTSAPDTFLVETPNAKGSVKGSDIFVSYLGGKTGVFVQEGAMSVLNPSAAGAMTRVVKGNSVLVNLNEAPGEARPIRDTEMAYFKRSVEPAFAKKWMPTKGAAEMKGIIVSLSGTVRLYKKGAEDWKEPKLNQAVSEGDKLQTEEDARVQITLSNGNNIALQPYTEMTFDILRYDSTSGNYENTLAITKGRLSAVVERTTKQLTFQVKTPTSVCGVRGTFVEVVVTPPAQAAGPQVEQPTTQVFFEGGSGYITSALTGQTQEIGAGQNTVVDKLGNIEVPVVTPPEQRNVIMQTWTSAQTMGSYSTAEGGAGVATTTTQEQQQSQPPVGPMMGGDISGSTSGSFVTDIKNFLDLISTLNFDDVFNNPVVLAIYDQNINFDDAGSTGAINIADFRLTIMPSNTWSGITSGTWSGNVPDDWYVKFTDTGTSDYMKFSITSPGDAWSGTVEGYIYSTSPNIDIDGTISGTSTGSTDGTFAGTASGTWHEEEPY